MNVRFRTPPICIVVALLAGCANNDVGATTALSSLRMAREVRSASSGPYLYAAAQNKNEVLIYPEIGYQQSPIGIISQGVNRPWGLYVDTYGSLYVANEAGTVTKYAAGSSAPSLTYSQGLVMPHYPIVDADGNLYVGNDQKYSAHVASIVEYRADTTSAYRTLETPGWEVTGLDLDSHGDLYAAYRDCPDIKSCASVEKWRAGSTHGRKLGMHLHQPQGLVVDNEGNVVVVDTSYKTESAYVYPPGRTNPSVRVRLPEGNVPTQLAITEDESELFVSSWNTSKIYVTAYPLTDSSTWTLVDTLPSYDVLQGIALSNGQVF